jgi:serine/threonine-protein kinase RsbW
MSGDAVHNDTPAVRDVIRVAAEFDQFAGLRARVEAFSLRAGLPDDTGHQITLILEELFANLLHHGAHPAGGGDAEISLHREGERVHIRFGDAGAPFNPLDAPEPGLEGGAEHRDVGGLGVHLVRELAAAAAYRRVDGRNILDLELTVFTPNRQGDAHETEG